MGVITSGNCTWFFTKVQGFDKEDIFPIAIEVGQLAAACLMLMKDIIFPDPLHLFGLNLWRTIAIIAKLPSQTNTSTILSEIMQPNKYSLHTLADAF